MKLLRTYGIAFSVFTVVLIVMSYRQYVLYEYLGYGLGDAFILIPYYFLGFVGVIFLFLRKSSFRYSVGGLLYLFAVLAILLMTVFRGAER